MTALPHTPNTLGARLRRAGFAVLGAALVAGALAAPARADGPVKGTVTVSTDDGYARLMLKLAEPVPAQVHLAWPVLVIKFAKPVDVAVDHLHAGAPDYIGAARMDPDGGAIRIALARKLKINSTPAAERLYVDLLAGELDRHVARSAERRGRAIGRARARGRAAVAGAARQGSAVAAAYSRQGRQRAHLHPLCLRSAGRHQSGAHAWGRDLHAHLRPRHHLGPGRRAGRLAADLAVDQERQRGRGQHDQLYTQGHTERARLP